MIDLSQIMFKDLLTQSQNKNIHGSTFQLKFESWTARSDFNFCFFFIFIFIKIYLIYFQNILLKNKQKLENSNYRQTKITSSNTFVIFAWR